MHLPAARRRHAHQAKESSAESALRNSPGCVRAGAAYGDIVPIAGAVSAEDI